MLTAAQVATLLGLSARTVYAPYESIGIDAMANPRAPHEHRLQRRALLPCVVLGAGAIRTEPSLVAIGVRRQIADQNVDHFGGVTQMVDRLRHGCEPSLLRAVVAPK